MKKIIFYFPFIMFSIIGLLAFYISWVQPSFYIMLAALLAAGILLSYKKILGAIIGILISLYIIGTGMNNWKSGDLEISVGIILFLFYSSCMIYILYKNKPTLRMMINKKNILCAAGLLFGIFGAMYLMQTSTKIPESEMIIHVSSPAVANHNEDSMIEHADAIIRGKILNISDFYDDIGTKDIAVKAREAYYWDTHFESNFRTQDISVEVLEALKGNTNNASTINIKINTYQDSENGRISDEPNPPTFVVNEEVVLFLKEYYNNYIIVGINQSAFYLDTTSNSNDKIFKHKTKMGNGFETFTYSQLLEKLR